MSDSPEDKAGARNAADDVFQPIDNPKDAKASGRELDMVLDIPVKIDVELGRTRMTIKELLGLGQGSVIALDGLAGDPMRILVNGHPIATGEVVVVDDKYGIRISEIVSPSERAAGVTQ